MVAGRMHGSIDEPRKGTVIDGTNLICRGWFYSEREEVKEIIVFVDGIEIGRCSYGLRRPDVKEVLGIGEAENSGLYLYRDLNFLRDGKYNLNVRVVTSNGCYELDQRLFVINREIASINRINIELTNICNLNCRWCTGSGDRKLGYMDFELFKKVIEEIVYDPRLSVDEIHLYNVGESLLHPKFQEIIQYLGKFWEENNLNSKRILVTNGTVLDDKLIDCILTRNGLDLVQFSVDGGNKDSYEWLRRGAKWYKTMDKISHFIQEKERKNSKIKVGLITIDLKQVFSEEFKLLLEKVDYFDFRPPHNWTGSEELDDFVEIQEFNPHPCWFVSNNLVILWNGDVTVCCADLHGKGVIGNVKKDDLFDLWRGKREELFMLQINGRKKEINLCKNCSLS